MSTTSEAVAMSQMIRHNGDRASQRLSISLIMMGVLLLFCRPCPAAPIPVLYSEGMVRGFLVLGDTKGTRIASGNFLQVVEKGGEVRTQVVFHFRDGSVHDETAFFTQQRHFVLQKYRLIQKGPSFETDMDVTFERKTGKYLVKTKSRKDSKEKVLDGTLDLPLDVYNGMVPTVAKNLEGKRNTIHMVVYTPTPRVIELEMVPSGEDKLLIGDLKREAVHYVLKPKLGLLKIPAAFLGRTPPNDHLWIITSDVPAFVRFDGPLATDGPIWSIELTSPVWPRK